MGEKPTFTVTSRFFEEQRPLYTKVIPSPYADPPGHRRAMSRLAFGGPSPKLQCTSQELAHAIATAALPTATIVPDTNLFSKPLDREVWDAIWTKRILLCPGVFEELKPWLKKPFYNKDIRDRLMKDIDVQLERARAGDHSSVQAGVEVRLTEHDFDLRHFGYDYYLSLLAVRKYFGPLSYAVLTKELGRPPTNDELVARIQGEVGERGYLLARKGIEAQHSPNKLTDEEIVLTATINAIATGSETIIITRDADVFEQYTKLLCLMKEHYRAMLIADLYADNPTNHPFKQVPVRTGNGGAPEFRGDSVLSWTTSDVSFHPLPRNFDFVNVYCWLLGGSPVNQKVTFCTFCAETQMTRVLKLKATTRLNSDRLEGRNCTITTGPRDDKSHEIMVSIGDETTIKFGPWEFGWNDFRNSLFPNELRTQYRTADESTGGDRGESP